MPIQKFEVRAPKAREVFLAGTFNGWARDTHPMTRSKRGDWTIALELETGSHEFKFIVDDEWCCEPGCEGPHKGCTKCVSNDMGTMNRIVEIS